MPIGISSVGDIITLSLLVKEIIQALDGARGSSIEYQALVRELQLLKISLLHVSELVNAASSNPELETLCHTIGSVVQKCLDRLQAFMDSTRNYERALTGGGSGNSLRDAAKKVQWKVSGQEREIARVRAELAVDTSSINMLLTAMSMTTENNSATSLEDLVLKQGSRHDEYMTEIRSRLDENNALALRSITMCSEQASRLQKLDTRIKDIDGLDLVAPRRYIADRTPANAYVHALEMKRLLEERSNGMTSQGHFEMFLQQEGSIRVMDTHVPMVAASVEWQKLPKAWKYLIYILHASPLTILAHDTGVQLVSIFACGAVASSFIASRCGS